MNFYDEIINTTKRVRLSSLAISEIKDKLRLKAKFGEYYADCVYKLEGNTLSKVVHIKRDFTSCDIKKNDFLATENDVCIINEFESLGFKLSYTLKNENPYPEVGQEDLKLRVYLNISWKQ